MTTKNVSIPMSNGQEVVLPFQNILRIRKVNNPGEPAGIVFVVDEGFYTVTFPSEKLRDEAYTEVVREWRECLAGSDNRPSLN